MSLNHHVFGEPNALIVFMIQPSGNQVPIMAAEYEESQCTFFGETSDQLVKSENVWHYNEVCLGSSKIGTECANRLYVFERIPGFRLDSTSDKEVSVSNRSECEDQCLNHTDLPCRSGELSSKSKTLIRNHGTLFRNSIVRFDDKQMSA